MWFSKSIGETLKKFNVDPSKGLSEKEAEERLKKYGPNKLQGKKKKTILQLLIAQLRDTLIYVLLGLAVITFFLGEYIDAVIILLVIIINAVLGAAQEVKAGKAIEALQKMSSPKALIKRNGEVKEINSEKVVPGKEIVRKNFLQLYPS